MNNTLNDSHIITLIDESLIQLRKRWENESSYDEDIGDHLWKVDLEENYNNEEINQMESELKHKMTQIDKRKNELSSLISKKKQNQLIGNELGQIIKSYTSMIKGDDEFIREQLSAIFKREFILKRKEEIYQAVVNFTINDKEIIKEDKILTGIMDEKSKQDSIIESETLSNQEEPSSPSKKKCQKEFIDIDSLFNCRGDLNYDLKDRFKITSGGIVILNSKKDKKINITGNHKLSNKEIRNLSLNNNLNSRLDYSKAYNSYGQPKASLTPIRSKPKNPNKIQSFSILLDDSNFIYNNGNTKNSYVMLTKEDNKGTSLKDSKVKAHNAIDSHYSEEKVIEESKKSILEDSNNNLSRNRGSTKRHNDKSDDNLLSNLLACKDNAKSNCKTATLTQGETVSDNKLKSTNLSQPKSLNSSILKLNSFSQDDYSQKTDSIQKSPSPTPYPNIKQWNKTESKTQIMLYKNNRADNIIQTPFSNSNETTAIQSKLTQSNNIYAEKYKEEKEHYLILRSKSANCFELSVNQSDPNNIYSINKFKDHHISNDITSQEKIIPLSNPLIQLKDQPTRNQTRTNDLRLPMKSMDKMEIKATTVNKAPWIQITASDNNFIEDKREELLIEKQQLRPMAYKYTVSNNNNIREIKLKSSCPNFEEDILIDYNKIYQKIQLKHIRNQNRINLPIKFKINKFFLYLKAYCSKELSLINLFQKINIQIIRIKFRKFFIKYLVKVIYAICLHKCFKYLYKNYSKRKFVKVDTLYNNDNIHSESNDNTNHKNIMLIYKNNFKRIKKITQETKSLEDNIKELANSINSL